MEKAFAPTHLTKRHLKWRQTDISSELATAACFYLKVLIYCGQPGDSHTLSVGSIDSTISWESAHYTF